MKVSIGHFIAGASIASAFFYASNQDANYKVNWSGKTISTNGIVLVGTAYVPATELARELGVTISVDQSGKVIAFGQSTGTATTTAGSPSKPASNIEWGKELITNGGFESGNGIKSYYDDQVTIPGWQITGRAQVGLYGEGAFTVPEERRPEKSGNKYYVGGWGDEEPAPAIRQTISLASYIEGIQTGANFDFKGFLGAPGEEELRTLVILTWLDKDGKLISRETLTGPAKSQVGEGSVFVAKSAKGKVPPTATTAVIQIKLSGPVNNWHATSVDNVSLTLSGD